MTKPQPSTFPHLNYPRHAALWRAVAPRMATDDLGHDSDHIRRVYQWCLRLAADVGESRDLAGACALIHDVIDIPKDHPERPMASERSAIAGRVWLIDAGYADADADAICEAVRTCSWSRGLAPTSMLGTILQDADCLDALGAVGVARTIAVAQRMLGRGRDVALAHPTEPCAQSRPLDDKSFALDHFDVKLLTLAEQLHLPRARAEGTQRHQVMLAFIEQLSHEWHAPAE